MKPIITFFLFLFANNISAQSLDINGLPNIEKYTIDSKILNEKRDIFVYVPTGFLGMDDSLSMYPVTFVLDGESQFLNTYSAIDYLSSAALGNDVMPRTIVVGIPNTNRERDLTPIKGMMGKDSTSLDRTGGGPNFLDFIISEVEPLLDSKFPLSAHRTIIGHSLGGLIVFEALLNRRDYFDNYLAIDPYLVFDNESYFNRILDTLRNVNLESENLYVATARTLPTFIDSHMVQADTSEIVKLTKSIIKFPEIADSENWKINYLIKHYPKENHFSVPYISTFESMKFFYDYYAFEEMIDYYHPSMKDRSDLVERLDLHYQEVSKLLGYTVIPMESYINTWAFGMSNFDRSDLAIDLFDYNIKLYPNHSTVYNSKGTFLQQQGNNKAAIEMFKKSLKLKGDEGIQKRLDELCSPEK